MWVQPVSQEDPLEEGMATHSVVLAWRIPRTEEPGGLQSRGSHRVRHAGSDEHTRNWVLQAGELQQGSTPRVVTAIIMHRTWQPIICCHLYCYCVVAKLCLILWGPHGLAHQAPLSMGFPRQGYWSSCHFLLQGTIPTQGTNLGLLNLQADSLPLSHQGNPLSLYTGLFWHFIWKE